MRSPHDNAVYHPLDVSDNALMESKYLTVNLQLAFFLLPLRKLMIIERQHAPLISGPRLIYLVLRASGEPAFFKPLVQGSIADDWPTQRKPKAPPRRGFGSLETRDGQRTLIGTKGPRGRSAGEL